MKLIQRGLPSKKYEAWGSGKVSVETAGGVPKEISLGKAEKNAHIKLSGKFHKGLSKRFPTESTEKMMLKLLREVLKKWLEVGSVRFCFLGTHNTQLIWYMEMERFPMEFESKEFAWLEEKHTRFR